MKLNKTIIEPGNSGIIKSLKELWLYRGLLETFFLREVKVRYRQTLLGVVWIILQPLLTMVIFTFFFGRLAKIPSGNLPYPLFSLVGLTFWRLFSTSISRASNSMISHGGILKKAYFPKLVLPFSTVFTVLVDFLINFPFLIIFSYIVGHPPSVWIFLILPISLVITITVSLGVGSFLSSVNVKYRDVRHALPFFIQTLMYLTPVIYSLDIVSPRNRIIMALNPMTSVIEMIRWTFSGGQFIDLKLVFVSLASAFLSLLIGLSYFNKTERSIADIV